ncbi:MAG: PD-(D/E)XK nuclease family protein, partial [Phycisphaerae bacterium]
RAGGEDVPRDLGFAAALRVPRFARETEDEDGQIVGNAYHRFMQHADLKRLRRTADIQEQLAQLVGDSRLSAGEVRLLSPADIVWFATTDEGKLLAQRADACRREVPFVYALPVAGGAERMVLRGVIDCLLESEDRLLILDYKTDRVRGAAAWEERIASYSVQLWLYALAAAEVFGRPATAATLVFLRQRRVVPVPTEPLALETILAWVGGPEELGGARRSAGDASAGPL